MRKMKQPFDPKLKEAAKEIQEILKKYDCNASMLLVSPTHCEYLFHIDSSWSVMKFEPLPLGSGNVIRFRSKKEDFPSKEKQDEATGATVHFLTSSLQFGRMVQTNMQSMIEMLRKHMSIAFEVWK